MHRSKSLLTFRESNSVPPMTTTKTVPHARLFTPLGYGTVLPVKNEREAAKICIAHNAYAFTMMKLECEVQDTPDGAILIPIPQYMDESALRYVGVKKLYSSEQVQEELTRILQEKQAVPLTEVQIQRVNSLRDTFNDLNVIYKQHKLQVSYVENPFFTPNQFDIREYMPLNDRQKVYDAKARLIWPAPKPRRPRMTFT
jgi:hypothetical protein